MLPVPADPALATLCLLTLGGVFIVPRAVVCIAAGAALGWSAVAPSMLGTALGTTLGFVAGRFVFQRAIGRFAARRPKVLTVMRAIDAEGWRLIGLLRLASPIPGPVVNFACGVTRIGYGPYIVTTLVAVLPQTLLFIYLGVAGRSAVARHSLLDPNTLSAAAGVALTALALWRLKAAAKRQSARALGEAAGTAAG